MSGKTLPEMDEKTTKSLVELLSLTRLAQDSIDDQVLKDVSGLLSVVFKLLNAISGTDLVDIVERALQDPELDKALLSPPKVGFWGLYKASRNQDVRKGLGVVVELLRVVGKASKS